MLFFIHAVFVFQSKSRHYTRGSQTMERYRYINCDFWDRSGKFWKWHCLRKTARGIKTPSSKLMILVSSCWGNNFNIFKYSYNAHNLFSFWPSFSWNLSGPPCIISYMFRLRLFIRPIKSGNAFIDNLYMIMLGSCLYKYQVTLL